MRDALRAEWVKLRTLPGSRRTLAALLGTTVAVSFLICASLDTQGGGAGCAPGAPGCGDEDVVLNSLSGVYLSQIAVVVLAVAASAGEHATGVLGTTFVALPRRRTVLAAKALVVGATVLVVGLVATTTSFLVGQSVLHGNGFTPDNGYPHVSLTDGPALRAVVGSALYLAAVAGLSLGVGLALRHAAAATSALLALLYTPIVLALLIPGRVGDLVAQLSPSTAGLTIQRTVDRADSIPLAPWPGLAIATTWSLALLLLATHLTHTRDA
jgi:ABC-2 type transport system permease protein